MYHVTDLHKGQNGWDPTRVTAGQNRPYLGLCPGPNIPLHGLPANMDISMPFTSILLIYDYKTLANMLKLPNSYKTQLCRREKC